MSTGCVIAADVGGTHTRLALARRRRGEPVILAEFDYPSARYASLETVLQEFLADPRVAPHAANIDAACLAVAGPVAGDACKLTNLDWRVNGTALAREFGWARVRLINDFSAMGYGIDRLDPGQLLTLQQGDPDPRGARMVVGAGTGLGVGLLLWDGARHVAHPSEGGHIDFAPADDLQDKLLAYLRRSFAPVSYERAVSGPGLLRMLEFFEAQSGAAAARALREAMQRGDSAAAVAEFGVTRRDPLAVQALDLFVCLYGAFAGNMALAVLARGGVYFAGGIASKLAGKLAEGACMRAFNGKECYGDLLASMPVHVVLDPRVGLKGALALACET